MCAPSAVAGEDRDGRGPGGPAARAPRVVVARRSTAQVQGGWVFPYRLRHTGPTGVILTPADVSVRVEGWVSNSRVSSHALPRPSRLRVEGKSNRSGTAELIASDEEAQRCSEHIALALWADGQPPADGDAAIPEMSLGPDAELHLRIRLEHRHVLYGDYDPLLGTRDIELTLGSTALADRVSLEREHYLAQPRASWPEPPEDRRDTRHYISAPDSLHLESLTPGHMYYRYPERPVRYGTRLRLRFWYLIAEGTEGECRVRLAQYKDTPSSWRVLANGGSDQLLGTVGRWTKYECVTRAEGEATTVALDFRIISETNVGEMWIDDVSLEPVSCATEPQRP
ncbi:MAG: hypothetical protein U0790_10790 [Isosphaeraceae bacterium]